MSHLLRRKTDLEWARSKVVSGADMAAIDDSLTKAVNGDAGGTYAPTTPVTIGGAGVGVSGPWVLGGSTYLQTSGTPDSEIVFGNDDAFFYGAGHADRTKELVQLIGAGTVVGQSPVDAYILQPAPLFGDPTLALAEVATAFAGYTQAGRAGARLWVDLRVHDESTLESVRFTFRVPRVRGATPPEFPSRFRVVRVDADGMIMPLRGQDLLTDRDGFQGPNPVTGFDWAYRGEDSGAYNDRQTFDYYPNRFSTIDLARYVYLAEIIEESGAGDGTYGGPTGLPPQNHYLTAIARCTNINVLANRR